MCLFTSHKRNGKPKNAPTTKQVNITSIPNQIVEPATPMFVIKFRSVNLNASLVLAFEINRFGKNHAITLGKIENAEIVINVALGANLSPNATTTKGSATAANPIKL